MATYNRTIRLYEFNGRYVTRAELRSLIEKLTDFVKNEATKIAGRFDAGTITAAEFGAAMGELLKSGHIVAASVGRGGRSLMTAKDWGRVGAKIKWQYGYLEKFTRKLDSGTLSKAYTANRARAYTSALYISYAAAFKESQTEVYKPETGEVTKDGEMLCYLEQNSKEGCEECTADAALGPMPVSEMGELGTRLCGDYCLCYIVFEDEPEFSK